ncbi:hypothetical protein [Ammoniphilus sp. 3BR4]|uniref:Ger(x)C family spore germination protein n=1 Tax=Ammoniphilus sp. 3BR4 TaxID=3158265 RepID=UPI003466C8E2
MIRLTVQIAIPGRIPLGPGEGGGGGEKPVWVLDVVGHTIGDALSNLQQQVADRLFFGHLRVIAVSEAVAILGNVKIAFLKGLNGEKLELVER